MKKILIVFVLTFIFFSCGKSNEEIKEKGDRIFFQASDFYERGYYTQAEKLFEELVTIDTRLKNFSRRANVYVYLGLINYNRANYIKAKIYYEFAQKDYRIILDRKGELLALNNIAAVYSTLGEFDEAEKIYKQIINQSLITADKEAEAISCLNLATLYNEKFDLENSFINFNKAFNAYEILGDIKGKLFTLNKLGEVYLQAKDFENALKTFDMAVNIQNRTGLKYLYQEIYNNIGLIFFHQNQISKALEFFSLALNVKDKSESSQYILIVLNNNIGDCYFKFETFSNAIKYYQNALDICENTIFKYLSPIILVKLADSYIKLYSLDNNEEHIKKAERYYQFAINRLLENGDIENLRKVYTKIISFYSIKGDKKRVRDFAKELINQKYVLNIFTADWEKDFAINLTEDFSFIQSLINLNEINKAYEIYYKKKVIDAVNYLLRFNDFKTFGFQKEKLKKLKTALYKFNSSIRILNQDLSLPKQNRDKVKIRHIKNSCSDLEKEITNLIEELSGHYTVLKPLNENISIENILPESNKLFVDFLLTENYLYVFFIKGNSITSQSIDVSKSDLLYNLKLFKKNIERISLDELKEFTSDNLKQFAQTIINEIKKYKGDLKEIVFLLNGDVTDFISHMIFNPEDKKFWSESYSCSYSYFIKENKNRKDSNDIYFLTQDTNKDIDRLVKNFKSKVIKDISQIESVPLNKGKLFVLSSLTLNEINPELSYLFDESQRKPTNIKLNDVIILNPNLIYLQNILYNEASSLIKLLGVLQIALDGSLIFPVKKISKEISVRFLYNYLERDRENFHDWTFDSVIKEMLQEKSKGQQELFYLIYFNK